jgi:hypothetical protein
LRAVIGEAAQVFITPTVRLPMKTTTRSAPTPPMLPAPLQQPRQLSIAFEMPAIAGLTAEQRTTALQALAAMLLRAAGVQLPEGDDVEQ